MIDVEDVILQRIDQLEEDEPELEMDYELIAPENYGVITVLTEDGAIGRVHRIGHVGLERRCGE